jgi:hypothetical protein
MLYGVEGALEVAVLPPGEGDGYEQVGSPAVRLIRVLNLPGSCWAGSWRAASFQLGPYRC